MSDAPFMIGANGLIFDTSFNGMPQGYGTVGQQPNVAPGESPNFGDAPTPGPWVATQLLPGALVQLRGGGEYDLLSTARSPMLAIGEGSNPQLGGTAGSIQVDIVSLLLGGIGSQRGLVFLVDNAASPLGYVGIWLNGANKPSFTITDVNGVTVATGTAGGPNGPKVQQIRLFWDSTGTILPSFVALYLNGVAQSFTGTVTGPWTGATPASVLYGAGSRGPVFGPYTEFVGTLNKVQVSNSPVPTNSQIAPATSQTPP